MNTAIIPQIHSISVLDSKIKLSDFYLDESVTRTFRKAEEIFLENQIGKGKYPIVFTLEKLLDEEYRIVAREGRIEIFALNQKGLMYGLFTLSELGLLNDGVLSEFDCYDKPALKLRGLSDDISRGQISTTQNFFDIIKKLARMKYNTYMPYIEDVFKFTSIEGWGRYSDPITKEEWKTIIEYAESYNITVRPIVNLLGHFDKSCNIKELQPLALKYKDGRVSSVMDPKNPEVRETIKKILKEIVDCFGEGPIHCGGDEPVALTEVYGRDEGGKLFIEHYTFIAEELKKLNCTMMMYADFFAPPWGDYAVPVERAKELPEDTEFVFWDYAVRPKYPFVDALHKQNVKMYISPGAWCWKRFACDIKTCYDNVKSLLSADKGRSRGMIMSTWADGGITLRELNWPGISIGANYCWNPESDYSYETVYYSYHKLFFGFSAEEAMLLDPVYHHDYIVKREHEHEFHNEMFRDPTMPVLPIEFKDKENISILQAAMKKAEVDIKSLSPERNIDAFNALILAVARAKFTADKIAMLPHSAPMTIEEALPYSENAFRLANEVELIKELHRKLWFATNRNSEWALCECVYDNLRDKLNILGRNLRQYRLFNIQL